MILGIDHVVILVRDLTLAMDNYGRIGFTVELGGEHPGGTRNALIAFADGSYLELITFKDPDQSRSHPWHDALHYGEGLVAAALSSSDLAADAAAARARGVTVGEPAAGARQRPDGQQLEWRTADVGSGKRGRERPFLIEDVTPRSWRVAEGWRTRHANSVVGIAELVLAVRDLDRAAADLAALLGTPLPPITETEQGPTMRFDTPRGTIVLLRPTESVLRDLVAERGDHVHAVTLATMLQGGEPAYDVSYAHGTNLRFMPV